VEGEQKLGVIRAKEVVSTSGKEKLGNCRFRDRGVVVGTYFFRICKDRTGTPNRGGKGWMKKCG